MHGVHVSFYCSFNCSSYTSIIIVKVSNALPDVRHTQQFPDLVCLKERLIFGAMDVDRHLLVRPNVKELDEVHACLHYAHPFILYYFPVPK